MQTAHEELSSLWVEEVNFCVEALFASIVLQDKDMAERWMPRIDKALAKLYPESICQAVANFMIVSYKMAKAQEEQAARGPGIGDMMR